MAGKMEPILFTRGQLATNCKMDKRTISKRLVGIEPSGRKGKSDLFYLWDVGRALFNPSAELGGTHEELTAAKTRESMSRTEKIDRENALAVGEIINGAEVDARIDEIGAAIGGGFRAFPAQLANRVQGLTAPEVKAIAEEMLRDILGALQEGRKHE